MADKLLNEDVAAQVRDVFQDLKGAVEVLFFGKKADCELCDDTQKLVEEVSALSEQISLSVYDIDEDAALAAQYHIDKAPGLVLAGRDGDQIIDYGVRFAGIPSGHEFSSLVHDFILVSAGDSGLNQETRDFLKELQTPLHLQVFVTPT